MPISCLPNAGLPSVVDGQMHYDLTPDQLAEYHRRFITEFGVSVVGGCCGTTPEHLAAVVDACRDLEPKPRTPGARGRRHVDLLVRAVPSGHVVPDHRRAHQRQRIEEVPRGHARGRLGHLRADGQGPGQGGCARTRRLRRLRGPRRHARHGRDRPALHHPGERTAGARLHRAPGARSRPAMARADERSSTRPTSRTAKSRARGSIECSSWPASTARP